MKNQHLIIVFVAALWLSIPLHATTYTWTGLNSGDWTDAGNWNSNGVPVSGTWDLADRILIDAAGATAPVPTNVPTFGDYKAPQFDWAYGTGAVSVTEIWKEGANWTTTVGDGSTANGLAELNYTFSDDMIHRHIDYIVRFTVEEDATLNISNPGETLLFAFDFNNRMLARFILGGTLTFEKAIDLSGNPGNYVTLTSEVASVTADFGGGYTNLAAVTAWIGDGLDFRAGGPDPEKLILFAKDNKDNTFTVRPKPPAGTVITLF